MRSLKLLVFLLISSSAWGQQTEVVTYKQLDTSELKLEVILPDNFTDQGSYPAIVFFFGGGWNSGSREHFRPQADYFAGRGVVCFLADYRTKNSHGTTPFTSVMDAKSAMRYVRTHAEQWQLDTAKIAAGGGSAGGHLAAATAMVKEYNDPQDDLSVSSRANALLLYNPVVDNGPAGYGYERIGEAYPDFSPLHNIDSSTPPTLFLLGTADHLIPVTTAEYYCMAIERVGGRCELKLYEGGRHGFFNVQNADHFRSTMEASDLFLQELGWISATN
ncbi:acetyl esterase/lipase [Lewinella aquimaris]|uniref:Acetyl esterase/lipase n=1 Tax=Neolewinella aquimaris TaxID=1835722 RepID=A0A840E457_9BACT|nr:alpha/beta hydrolase [Neolewinella aquimaris]MBB4078733.1 acetyl esterase/lipase [Neolewinella aquimaris]